MENIIATRFLDIKNLETTQVEILDASHINSNYVLAKITYSKFDPVTGAETTESVTLTKEQIMNYRQSLIDERARLTLRFDNLNSFLAVAGPLVTQWLIDNPQET